MTIIAFALAYTLAVALMITAIHMIFREGMLLGWFRIMVANDLDKWIGLKWSKYIQKPLWDCLTCMSGIWTIILMRDFNLYFILIVCGWCAIIDKFLNDETEVVG